MEIAHRDYQDFKDDKLVAKENHVPVFAQVTHSPLLCKGDVC